MYLIFDTETTGLPKDYKLDYTHIDNWPRCVQLAWQLHDEYGELIEANNYIIKPDNYDIPYNSTKIHGISNLRANKLGVNIQEVLDIFNTSLQKCDYIIGHNVNFDINVIMCEYHRYNINNEIPNKNIVESCNDKTANICQLPGGKNGKYKFPKLDELYLHLFQEKFNEAHNAAADVEATSRIFLELIRREHFDKHEIKRENEYFIEFKSKNPTQFNLIGLNISSYKDEDFSNELQQENNNTENTTQHENINFIHLRNHSEYTIGKSPSFIKDYVKKAKQNNHKAIAITDLDVLYGAFQLISEVKKINAKTTKEEEKINAEITKEEEKINAEITKEKEKIKAIIGIELNVCNNLNDKSIKDNGKKIVLLAKNKEGYINLAKLSSIALTQGFYYVPRIDISTLQQYSSNIIALSGGNDGIITSTFLNEGLIKAEGLMETLIEIFKDDFYLEIEKHYLQDDEHINHEIIQLSEKYQTKIVATNNNYFTDKEDYFQHQVLNCIVSGKTMDMEIGNSRNQRWALPNDSYYYKSTAEMIELFSDNITALDNTIEIYNKIEQIELEQPILLPIFEVPEQFRNKDLDDTITQYNYLESLTSEGAKYRYGEDYKSDNNISTRIDEELNIIKNSGYSGYFLIVRDIIINSLNNGISVGPGRGSAAGSVVAYCLKITNVDPLKYNLLFERFLNPDRISMPDIDVDFQDEKRGEVIEYIKSKYGADKISQIITFSKLGTKSGIGDVARVFQYNLNLTNKLKSSLPIGIELIDIKNESREKNIKKIKKEEISKLDDIIATLNHDSIESKILNTAIKLNDVIRNTGVHACGLIITPKLMTDIVPIAPMKKKPGEDFLSEDLVTTQYDSNIVENVGLLKMDILGLKNLSTIQEALRLIKKNRGINIKIDEIPLDDEATIEIFQQGNTTGIFQFESPGMKVNLKRLKPTKFEDIIAMNALYRPGPMDYLPEFIDRKNGIKEIIYDLDDCQEYLEETYGITVYQEQVMLLSQKLSNFTKGEADSLRKAMGKKLPDQLAKLYDDFIVRGLKNGHDIEKLKKIWKDWEAFASYAFNKSHATCYSFLAFQTAYLKSNYTPEYLAALLTSSMSSIEAITFIIKDCDKMGIKVLAPDINQSSYNFEVVNNEIVFGLAAIKGVGEKIIQIIEQTREKEGKFTSLIDLCKKVPNSAKLNHKALENLIKAGAFDNIIHVDRANFLFKDKSGKDFIDEALKFGKDFQDSKASIQATLFDFDESFEVKDPEPQKIHIWSEIEKLNYEKEVLGFYMSGHPLDIYKLEIEKFTNIDFSIMNENKNDLANKDLFVACIVKDSQIFNDKTGNPYGKFNLIDMNSSYELMLYKKDFLKFSQYFTNGSFLYINFHYTPSYNDSSKMYLNIKNIDFMSDVLLKKLKNINIFMKISEINNENTNNLITFIEKYKSNHDFCNLYLVLSNENQNVRLKSLKYKFSPNKEFFDNFQEEFSYPLELNL